MKGQTNLQTKKNLNLHEFVKDFLKNSDITTRYKDQMERR
jgi:hypothetical protein